MNSKIIEQCYVKPLIEQKIINVLPQSECNRFNDFISSHYKWVDYSLDRIDWGNSIIATLDLRTANKQEINIYLSNSYVGQSDKLGVVYSALEPGVFGDFEIVAKNLDLITAHCPGPFFIVGMKLNSYGIYNIIENSFVEGDWFKLTLKSLIPNC